MRESVDNKGAMLSVNFDAYRLVTDIIKKWWMILCVSVSVSLLTYIAVKERYEPSYTVNATYVITTRGGNSGVLNNLATARDTAAKFSQILNSTTLRKKVSEDLGVANVPGTINAKIVPETNLMNFSVTSSTPRMAFEIASSVMRNYQSISDYMIGNAIMEVLQAPEIPDHPDVELDITSAMSKSFVISLLVMILLTGIFSCMRDTIRKSADVELKLDARLIGTLAHEKRYFSLRSQNRKSESSLLITSPAVSFGYVESTKKIAAKLSGLMRRVEAKTLVVTSYMENEGKSTVSSNIALALSQNNKKVCLMDLDLRRPTLYKLFGVDEKNACALGKVLTVGDTRENLIGKIEHTNLFTVFNSTPYTNSSELISRGRLPRLLQFLERYFDYIVIDTPPMALVSDTEEIADFADASVLVVKEHLSEAKDLNDSIDVLNALPSKFLGCILNDAHAGALNPSYGYGGYYGKKYGKNYETVKQE